MRAPVAVSPFAAKSSQEQKEQWIWWQCQQDATMPVEPSPMNRNIPELQLPRQQEEKPVSQSSVARQSTRHSQYDAVVRRMQNATRQVRHYTSVKG